MDGNHHFIAGPIRGLNRYFSTIHSSSAHRTVLTSPVKPAIGVIGGVGPYAGLDLVRKIFDHTLARTDQDHLPVALLSLSSAIPDRTEYLLGREDVNPAVGIAQVALQLERMGVRVAGIPCNTAHADAIFGPLLVKLREAHSGLKILHLIGETLCFLRTEYPHAQRIGVLSTSGTYQVQLYARPLAEAGYRVIVPTLAMQEAIVHPAIYHPRFGIKAQSNPVSVQARQWIEEAIRALRQDGAEAIILGCTELPLAITESVLHSIPMIDPATILARSLIREVAPNKLKPLTAVAPG
jgi:aspartate racemase